MAEEKREYFNLVGYVKNQRKKIGYAYETKNGNLCIKADEMIDASQIGRLLKKGLYVEKRSTNSKVRTAESHKIFNSKAA